MLDNGYMKPHHWVDDNPLQQGNNGSLDPSKFQQSLKRVGPVASRKGDEPPSSCKRLVSWKRVTEPDMAYVTLKRQKWRGKTVSGDTKTIKTIGLLSTKCTNQFVVTCLQEHPTKLIGHWWSLFFAVKIPHFFTGDPISVQEHPTHHQWMMWT